MNVMYGIKVQGFIIMPFQGVKKYEFFLTGRCPVLIYFALSGQVEISIYSEWLFWFTEVELINNPGVGSTLFHQIKSFVDGIITT